MKRIKSANSVILLSLFSIILLGVALVISCRKTNNQDNTALKDMNLTQIAKNYFTALTNKETGSSSEPPPGAKPTKQIKSSAVQTKPLSKMSQYILWNKSMEYRQDGIDYVIVPFKEELKPFQNKSYEFFRDIIFYQDKNKKNNLDILEVLSDKNGSFGNDLQKIATISFANKYFSRTQNIEGLNASVIFYNEKYLRDTSFQFHNGNWSPARISFRMDIGIRK